ncbi:MAG: 3-phosphoshikimate 1-carboxyvinyltransferase [Verrucomicrobiales bacterium]|jgi:3-phosphoshikimate 1-carboxyvinyltransferase
MSNGPCRIDGFLNSEDCMATVKAIRALGIRIDAVDEEGNDPDFPTSLIVHGGSMHYETPEKDIDCGNSGTTMRLLSGILAAQPFESRLTGDASLTLRPMSRIIEPLQEMGATIEATGDKHCAPLTIRGGNLKAIRYKLPVASAQVKSAVLLAGLFTEGKTTVVEPVPTRDHTEKMLEFFQVNPRRNGNDISIYGGQKLESRDIFVPGDISSAAFWIVAAAAQTGSDLMVKNVGLNKTRTGILDVLVRMGAQIQDHLAETGNGEPIGNVSVKGRGLKATTIGGSEIPNVIDELPILAVAAALAEGTTTIKDAQELRVKETDRIAAVATNLRAMGVTVREFHDGMEIDGGATLKGARLGSYGDHRIAMAFAIAGLFADSDTIIEGAECVETSYPGFSTHLAQILG